MPQCVSNDSLSIDRGAVKVEEVTPYRAIRRIETHPFVPDL